MAEPFSRLAAALADRYRIERELGQGGMATVYLAEDLKHDRKVALKVLRPELAAVLGADRFVQEIKTTASLQHPNILPLFDSGRAVVPPLHGVERGTGGEAFLYYVMPYVEGETLRDRLDRETQLGIEEAVKITTEVADALQYAHQQGVIHRDIKPENILLHAGRPIVADFGIALAVSAAAGGRMTETGLSLGTPHYMSPEQATAEKDLTNRSDIYSLGAVLYEMLTGDPPHTGSSAQQIIMKIVTEEATPVTNVRKTVPPNIAAAVAKSLQKLRADRFDSARSFAEALRNPAFRVTPGAGEAFATPFPGQSPPSRVTWRGRLRDPFLLGTALVAVAAIAVAIGLARRPMASPTIVPPIRFPITSTDNAPVLNDYPWGAAISPDGGTVVYAVGSSSKSTLFARHTDSLEGHPIPGTASGHEAFFSPDGQWLAFVAGGKTRKVRLDGSAPVTITDVAVDQGADWSTSDQIVLGENGSFKGLSYVSAAGGEPVPLTHPDSGNGELGHRWPIALPDGKSIVFTIWSSSAVPPQLAMTSLDDRRVAPLGLTGIRPLAFLDGMLVYLRADGSVMAVTLDVRKKETVGSPIPVHDPVRLTRLSWGIFISPRGAMVTSRGDSSSRLVWIGRDGRTTPAVPGSRVLSAPRLAPDGRRVAVVVTENGKRDVWIFDPTLSRFSRLTSIGTVFVVDWSADGSRVLFIARGEGQRWAVWSQIATGGSPAQKLWEDSHRLVTLTVSPDGTSLLLTCFYGSLPDLIRVALDSVPEVRPYLVTKAAEFYAQFAPNGRWVALVSNESGQYEVYVASSSDPSGRIQVSVNGGDNPTWSRDGTRLYYQSDSALVAARVTFSPTFKVMRYDTVLVNAPLLKGFYRSYDVAADGRRILGIVPEHGFQLVVSPNWITEFRRRVAASEKRGQ